MHSDYPPIVNGKSVYDLDSHKYLKIWHGPQHPGVTGNMSLELDIWVKFSTEWFKIP